MSKIQIKRGLSTAFGPITLLSGEPAFLTDTGKLYVGDGTKKVLINPIDKPLGLNTTDEFSKFRVNEFGQITTQARLTVQDLPSISASDITGLGTAALLNSGTASGNVPVLDANGKLNTLVLPSIAITNTFVVASEAEMLALGAEEGDVAIRTDINETFILQTAPAATLKNWVKLLTPTDKVASVNGKTGIVVLSPIDIAMTGYSKAAAYSPIVASDNLSVAVGKLEKNFDGFAPINSPILTGTPKSTTPAALDSSTLIATTAFVTSAITVATANIDGGTF
ncbi:MAG: hypothetical protein RR400_02425 [Clostridia bacterium]